LPHLEILPPQAIAPKAYMENPSLCVSLAVTKRGTPLIKRSLHGSARSFTDTDSVKVELAGWLQISETNQPGLERRNILVERMSRFWFCPTLTLSAICFLKSSLTLRLAPFFYRVA